MDKIDSSITYLKELKDIYADNCVDHLEEIKKQIQSEINGLIDKHKNNYGLTYRNSVHTSDLFSLQGRVKKSESLFEKFIRKDEGLILLNKLNLESLDDIEKKKDEIINYFYSYEDIIGIKIVTELKEDSNNMYQLLLDNHNEISDKIIFKDIKKNSQPKPMKNGLKIFNIKGVYFFELHQYGFELQIKSKINSAWGDLDHSIFYKNYNFSPVKNTAQITMNHVGKMLDEIEQLLYSIRNAENDYVGNADKSRFIEQIDKYLSESIREKFNSNYNIDKLCDVLHFSYKNKIETSGDSSLELAPSNYYHLMELEFQDKFCNTYRQFRDNSFEAMILENIFLKLIYSKETINAENYECKLKEYLEVILLYIVDILGEESLTDLKDRGVDLKNIFIELFTYVNSIDLFIKRENYELLNEWIKQVLDDYEVEEEDKIEIIKLWLLVLNRGNLEDYLKTQDINIIYGSIETMKTNIDSIKETGSMDIEMLQRCYDQIYNGVTQMKKEEN